MANPIFVEEEPISLSEVKGIVEDIIKRDTELNYRSNKAKDYLDHFVVLSASKKKDLQKKLEELDLTRLKKEHIIKFIDFLPKDIEELKSVLLAYPLSLPKKDQDAIVKVVREFVK